MIDTIISFLSRVFCKHEFAWYRNIHGDEINLAGGMRSWWTCRKCGKRIMRPYTHDPSAPYASSPYGTGKINKGK